MNSTGSSKLTDHGNRNPRSGRGDDKDKDSQVVNRRNPCQANKPQKLKLSNIRPKNSNTTWLNHVATWNVKTLYQAGKLRNVQVEMKRLGLQVLGISEARWTGSGSVKSGGYITYYSGRTDNVHESGVAIILEERLENLVDKFVPFSDRVMMITIKSKINVNVIQVYAPTANSTEDVINEFYNELKQVLNNTKKNEINLIMGDFNAKVGEDVAPGVTGGFGLGERNERGNKLVEFCQEENFIITNTLFKQPKRRLYTWTSPRDGNGRVIRNQIDYILINKRFQNACKCTKTYPSADAATDHNLLATKILLKFKKIKKPIPKKKDNRQNLKQEEVKQQFTQAMNNKIQENITQTYNLPTVEERWGNIRNGIISTAAQSSTTNIQYKKQVWMTDEIIEMLEERRKLKNKNDREYKRKHNLIRKKIRDAKELWMQERCDEIEKLQRKHDEFNTHKKIKEVTAIGKKNTSITLTNDNGHVLSLEDEVPQEWEKYIKELFKDDRETLPNLPTHTGPSILKAEVEKAIHQAKCNKACGPDQIYSEWLKLLSHDNIKELTTLFNQVYDTGNIPSDWLRSNFIPLPKKSNVKKCSDCRLISLMSHAAKLLLHILLNRANNKCDEMIGREQFGFRRGLGTREALFSMQTLLQRCWEVRKPVYMCFIDFEKAFDRVQHNKLITTLQNIQLDDKDINLIAKLYWRQTATIVTNNRESNPISIERGVRQGCVLSPTLFNVYSETPFKYALKDQKGIIIGGETINSIRYADDAVIMAETIDDLQELINRVDVECRKWGLSININKTKYMVANKIEVGPTQLELNHQTLERVHRFKYLGCWITQDLDPSFEIRCRIEQARNTFQKLRPLLSNRSLNLEIREKFTRCYIWSILLYGCEAWTVNADIMNRIEAFEMWLYRRILRIPWTSRTRNEEVLRKMGHQRILLNAIKRRKLEYLGHIIRGPRYEFLRLILNGKIEGRKWIGRKKLSWLRNLRQWTGLTADELLHAAQDRLQYRDIVNMVVANVP